MARKKKKESWGDAVGSAPWAKLIADAMARLDAATENAVLRVRFDAGGATRLEPTSRDFEGLLSGLFLLVARARS